MKLFDISGSKDSLKGKIEAIKVEMEKTTLLSFSGKVDVMHYGAYEINPKYLVFWICIGADEDKKSLQNNVELNSRLRNLLIEHKYPAEAIGEVYIGFESQETVDRESGGNWWHHFK
ncbi:hypothetical protein [Flavobacterium subsaxonicum]|nr:hypothetical protein [Flavobacterium subsaxonicum]